MNLAAAEIKQQVFARSIIFASHEEAKAALAIERFLQVKIVEGQTWQKPLDHKRKADFFIPEMNLVVEYHPILLEREFKEVNCKILKHCLAHLTPGMRTLVEAALKDEKEIDYFRRRRFFMDHSPFEDVRTARLQVVTSLDEFYKIIIRPYSKDKVSYRQYCDFIAKV